MVVVNYGTKDLLDLIYNVGILRYDRFWLEQINIGSFFLVPVFTTSLFYTNHISTPFKSISSKPLRILMIWQTQTREGFLRFHFIPNCAIHPNS